MSDLNLLMSRLEKMLDRVERLLPPGQEPIEWKRALACRWRRQGHSGYLQEVSIPHRISLRDLYAIDDQKKLLDLNTRQFLFRYPYNNILLTGSKGTGKSSLIKALLNKYSKNGLRLIEVDKSDLHQLPEIIETISNEQYRFMIFCDDLSFGSDDDAYKSLKVALDGSVAGSSENVMICATSNRRHLMPEYMTDNLETKYRGEEIHASENVEEKISLSERFGLWIHFDGFTQDEYVKIVTYWVKKLSSGSIKPTDDVIRRSLQWSLERGSRSGRIAYQFARNEVGSELIRQKKRIR